VDKSSFDLYIVRNFLDQETCRELIAEMRRSEAGPALTYGKGVGAVDEQVRRVRHIAVSPESIAYVSRRLMEERAAIAGHFGVNLAGFEEPQFLRYVVGDFFVAHQDGNTGLIRLETDRTRRISISIFLNEQSLAAQPESYRGGSLVFLDWRNGAAQEIAGIAGMLVAFRSETTHEITPVTSGERYAIVSWYLRNPE
jgi:SM-20-related protein